MLNTLQLLAGVLGFELYSLLLIISNEVPQRVPDVQANWNKIPCMGEAYFPVTEIKSDMYVLGSYTIRLICDYGCVRHSMQSVFSYVKHQR